MEGTRPAHDPEAVAGDKFRLGGVLDNGVMLLGRKTWQLFSRIWPGRDHAFATRVNAVPTLVASRTMTDTFTWASSRVVSGGPVDAVRREGRDVIITGSLSIVHPLITEDLMDDLCAAFASTEGRATAADAAYLAELAPVRSMIFTADDTLAQQHTSA